ncbi:MAG TPA: Rho termination factor N-terminal domain-containing protein, partial [Jatrophihabitans sp.]|nr:Rho termination factor N-terminal domain-containing protein [Jatrophihabitans sp.]
MTDTQEQTLPADAEQPATAGAPAGNGAAGRATTARKRGSLSTMLLPELQQVASGLGISTTKMKKSDLVAAIQAARASANGAGDAPSAAAAPAVERPRQQHRARSGAAPETTTPDAATAAEPAEPAERSESRAPRDADRAESGQRSQRDGQQATQRDGERRSQQDRPRNQGNQNQQNNQGGQGNQGNQQNQNRQNDDDEYEGGRRRGRRYRDRRGRNRDRQGGQGGGDAEPTVTEDDVLLPVAGVVDCIEDKNTWFVRTEGFYASLDDVYVATSFVRRFGLRRGDAVTGAVRQPREGERREKYNPLVRLDTVNGRSPDEAKNRVEFTRLTPLYPQERLRLETEPHILTTRVIDLVMPIGKGQRALIVSPPKAGKTMVLQALANA